MVIKRVFRSFTSPDMGENGLGVEAKQARYSLTDVSGFRFTLHRLVGRSGRLSYRRVQYPFLAPTFTLVPPEKPFCSGSESGLDWNVPGVGREFASVASPQTFRMLISLQSYLENRR